jgi:outer membrane autotransporter protein
VFTTDLYSYSTSVTDVEVNSAGNSDKIIASGFAELGGIVVVTPEDLNFTTPLTYSFISANGGITGEFSSVASSIPALMSLTYDPSMVELTYLPLAAVGLSGNSLTASNCFAAPPVITGSDRAALNAALLALSFDELKTAFAEMSPAQFSGMTEVQLLDAILVRSTYTKHLQEFSFNKNSRCGRSVRLWIGGIGQWQNQQKSGTRFGYNDTTFGATIGIDYSIRNLAFGFAFSTTYDHFHLKNFGSKGNINSYYGGIYGHWNYHGYYMNGSFLGAQNNYRSTRQLSFGTLDRQARSKHSGNEWLINFGFGYRVCPSRFQWTPYINLDYVAQHERNYTEAGANSLDLHVYAKNAALFQGEAGVLFSANYCIWNGVFVPMLALAYINQTPFSSENYHANFVNSACGFAGKAGTYERNLFTPRLAFTYKSTCNKVNASIYYDAQVGSRYWAQDVGFDLAFRF